MMNRYLPGWNSVTFGPTLSTIPAPSWPKIQGNFPSGSWLPKVYASVWHIAVARIFTLISFALGESTSISSMVNGWFASQATAALHLITWKHDYSLKLNKC